MPQAVRAGRERGRRQRERQRQSASRKPDPAVGGAPDDAAAFAEEQPAVVGGTEVS